MDFVKEAHTERGGWLWAASVARSLLPPGPLNRSTWRGARHPCALWWGGFMMVDPGDVTCSFESKFDGETYHCIESVERPPPPQPQ